MRDFSHFMHLKEKTIVKVIMFYVTYCPAVL